MSRILLAGDSLIVNEFAAACRDGGHEVFVLPDRAAAPGAPAAPLPEGVRSVRGLEGRCEIALELTLPPGRSKEANLVALDRLPREVPIFTNTLATTLAEQSSQVKHPARLAGIGAYASVLEGKLLEFTTAADAPKGLIAAAETLARSLGKEAAFVQDLPGMVLPRIRCALVNEACFALAEGIATGAGIDTAMKLGASYPTGPVEWGERVGPSSVLEILEALNRFYGEERYRAAPLLRRATLSGSIAAAAGLRPPRPAEDAGGKDGSATTGDQRGRPGSPQHVKTPKGRSGEAPDRRAGRVRSRGKHAGRRKK
jgi:3-hydroxybutyryl-CoA dehydrogenase